MHVRSSHAVDKVVLLVCSVSGSQLRSSEQSLLCVALNIDLTVDHSRNVHVPSVTLTIKGRSYQVLDKIIAVKSHYSS